MRPEQVIAIQALMADLYAQVLQLQAENAELREQLAGDDDQAAGE